MTEKKFQLELSKIVNSISTEGVTIEKIVSTYNLLKDFGVGIDIEYLLNTYGKTFSDLPKDLQKKIKNSKKSLVV